VIDLARLAFRMTRARCQVNLPDVTSNLNLLATP
jgi:hypothetical protein